MFEQGFLGKLVELASLGTSGICIFAIFWIGWLMTRQSSQKDTERQRTLRFFMLFCVAISVVSAAAGFWSSRASDEELTSLKRRIEELALRDKAYTVTGTVRKDDGSDPRSVTITTLYPPPTPDSSGELVDLVVRRGPDGKLPSLCFTCAGYDIKGMDLNNPRHARILTNNYVELSPVLLRKLPGE